MTTTIGSATLELTEQLIALRSPTPHDGGCQQVLGARLAPLGFVLETIESGPSDQRVTNLWAKRAGRAAGAAARTLVFAGHTDVVPTGPLDAWTFDPFTPTRHDGRLYGRGASDMKTSIAAFVVAVENFIGRQPDCALSIALLLTSDEEGPATDGTVVVCRQLVERGERLDWCVVGEPTSQHRTGDMIKNGRRGSLSGKLTVRGVQGHIAYPQLAKNPVHLAAPALAELAATAWDHGNEFFQPTGWQVSNFHAGTGATNVIPGSAVIDFNFRFSTENDAESLQKRVREVLDRHRLDYEIAWNLSGLPFLTTPGDLVDALRAAIHAETGLEPELSTTGGTSDGRFIARICPQTIEFGPPNATIHQIDEHIVLADIEPLANIYCRLLANLDAITAVSPPLIDAPPPTVLQLIEAGAAQLEAAGVAFGHGTTNAFDEAAWLVLWRLGLPLDDLDAVAQTPVSQTGRALVEALLQERIESRRPAAYLTGEAWLQGVPFHVDERTIVPRSFIAELIADGSIDPWLGEHTRRVLDLCTGNGSLAVLAATAWPDVSVDAADLSTDALAVARSNVDRHALADRIRLVESDGLAACDGRYDLILCNPPYVNAASMATLPAEYRAEPALALDGGANGMDFIVPLLAAAADSMSEQAVLVLEIGHERAHFEAAFPTLEVVWLEVSAGDDQVLLVTREVLLAQLIGH